MGIRVWRLRNVLGDDACDYLAPGERFVLWRGHDLGSGVVVNRIFI